MLPIVQRELRVACRSPKLYSNRLRWGILQAIAACGILVFSAGGFRPNAAEWFFGVLTNLALVLSLLEGVRKTSDALAEEKRAGTLGFLFLSTLSGADVVLGKFAGALIRGISGLLSFLPILATSLLVGGTTLGEFWRVAAVLAATLCASLSFCLFTSSISRRRSITAGFAVLICLCLVPLVLAAVPGFPGVQQLSPFGLLAGAKDLRYSRAPGDFWLSLAGLLGLSFTALAAAAFIVPRSWHDQPGRTVRAGGKAIRADSRRAMLLTKNPVLWLNFDARGSRVLNAIAVALLLLGLLPCIGTLMTGRDWAIWSAFPAMAAGALCLILYFRVATQSAGSAAYARQEGSLELLLSTPLTSSDIHKGWWLAVWRTIRVSVVCLLILLCAILILSGRGSIGQAIWVSKWLLEVLLELPVLAAVGMWMGLYARSRAAAVVYTLLLGGVVPWIVCVFTIPVQTVLIFRAVDRVKKSFENLRSGGYTPALEHMLRPPVLPNSAVPPVLR